MHRLDILVKTPFKKEIYHRDCIKERNFGVEFVKEAKLRHQELALSQSASKRNLYRYLFGKFSIVKHSSDASNVLVCSTRLCQKSSLS